MQKLSSPIDLIKKSFQVFFKKENLRNFLKIYIILVPFSIFSLVQGSLINKYTGNLSLDNLNTFSAEFGWMVGMVMIINLAYLVFSFWVGAAGIKAVSEVVRGNSVSVKETFRFAWKKLRVFFLLSVVVGLITGFGFLLLIIPGILFLVWFRFSGFELIEKKIGVREAIGNSRRLTSGRFWQVFGRIIVFGLFGTLVQFVFWSVPYGIGDILLPMLGALLILPHFLLYKELQQEN